MLMKDLKKILTEKKNETLISIRYFTLEKENGASNSKRKNFALAKLTR